MTISYRVSCIYVTSVHSHCILYYKVVGISVGGRQNMFTKQLVDSVVRQRAGCCDVLVRCRGDCRLCPEVTRGS